MNDERIGTYFWLSEFLHSDYATRHGIDNTPGPDELENIRNVLGPGMGRVRDLLGCPIFISSGYRAPFVNSGIGGSKKSQHVQGLAADFTCPAFGTPLAVCYRISMSDISFDQLIHEGTWAHISFTTNPRKQVMTAHFGANGVTYTQGL